MRNRATRPVATILSFMLLAGVPAQAGTIPFRDVVQVFGGLRSGGQTQELRLRSISQSDSTPVSGDTISASTKVSSPQQQGGEVSADGAGGSAGAPSSLISTVAGPQEGVQQQGSVEVVEEGDVTGTVCDCGEILVPSGFKFPWLALAGIPLICLTGICTSDNPPPCVVNCGETVIPEPATLLLLSSGLAALGAGARRRYKLSRPGRNLTDTTEV